MDYWGAKGYVVGPPLKLLGGGGGGGAGGVFWKVSHPAHLISQEALLKANVH